MVRGAEYAFTFTVKNRATGEPITDPTIVNAIELVLRSSGNNVSLKKYEMGAGITSLGNGQYKVVITAPDTLLLPTIGKAFLEGFTLPVKRSVKIDLGSIADNQANYPIDE